jgi:hypothetical protein
MVSRDAFGFFEKKITAIAVYVPKCACETKAVSMET